VRNIKKKLSWEVIFQKLIVILLKKKKLTKTMINLYGYFLTSFCEIWKLIKLQNYKTNGVIDVWLHI